MKTRFILMSAIAAVAIGLTGCSTTDIKATMGSGDSVVTSNHHLKPISAEQVKVYHSKSEMRKRPIVIGRVTAQNYNMIGMTISQESIMTELKTRAAAMGANGITHISAGLAQTTAEAILLK